MQNKPVNKIDYRIKYPTRNLIKQRNGVPSKQHCTPELAALVKSFKNEAQLWKKALKSRAPMTCGDCKKTIRNFVLRSQGNNEGNLLCSCNNCSSFTILKASEMFKQDE